MYIRPDSQTSPLELYRQQQVDKLRQQQAEKSQPQADNSAATGDVVSVSSDARLMAEASRAAQDSPDVRQEKVAQLKEQVQNGTYKVDNESIARGLLREDMGLFVK